MLVVLAVALAMAGCGGGDAKGAKDSGDSPTPESTERMDSVLVVDGTARGADGTPTSKQLAKVPPPAATSKPKKPRIVTVPRKKHWPKPPMLEDGTIDDGADPFDGSPVQVQPLPVEDDPRSTAAIDQWASRIRRVELEQWNSWMDAGLRSPWSQEQDAAMKSLVKVTVERCGGARTVATGVVLADQTVVTTVHAIESPARRVRITAADGSGARIPAMIRYLDVDDDVAVLKVPGLTAPPMQFHVVTGDAPQWGHAYGIGRGGPAGTARRTPAVVAMVESSLTVEQPDGLAEEITDRPVYPFVGAVDSGFSGGVVTATNDPRFVSGWGFHGLIRARVPFRADTAGVAVPSRVVGDALKAHERLDEWYEHPAGVCPQWRRP